jgi:hypothetical protein
MINKSPNAFEDAIETFERALNSPHGIRIVCGSRGEAVRLRARFHYWRTLDREQNKKVFPADDPRHGVCVYDRFELRIPRKGQPDENSLYIEPRSALSLNIEELGSPPEK